MWVADDLEDADQLADGDGEPGLLGDLAPDRVGEVFALLQAAPGKRPQAPAGIVASAHHEQGVFPQDYRSYCYLRTLGQLRVTPFPSTATGAECINTRAMRELLRARQVARLRRTMTPGTSASSQTQLSWAHALLAGGVIAASLAPILIRYADEADPLAISFWRCFAGASILWPFARGGLRAASGRSVRVCAVAGAFLALHFATWITSLELTTVASSVLLVSTTPIFVALAAPLLVDERLTRAGWAGIALAFAGTVLIAGVDFAGSSPSGNALALAGGAAAGGYVLAGRIARRDVRIVPYAVLTYGVAAAVLGVVCLLRGVELTGYSAPTWWAIAGLVAGPQLLGHTVINLVLSRVDVTTVSVSFMAEPIIAAALAAALFDEIPTLVFYLGGVSVLAGIYFVSTNQKTVEQAPA